MHFVNSLTIKRSILLKLSTKKFIFLINTLVRILNRIDVPIEKIKELEPGIKPTNPCEEDELTFQRRTQYTTVNDFLMDALSSKLQSVIPDLYEILILHSEESQIASTLTDLSQSIDYYKYEPYGGVYISLTPVNLESNADSDLEERCLKIKLISTDISEVRCFVSYIRGIGKANSDKFWLPCGSSRRGYSIQGNIHSLISNYYVELILRPFSDFTNNNVFSDTVSAKLDSSNL